MQKCYNMQQKTNPKDTNVDFCLPCTTAGCLELLDRCQIPLEGKRMVVLGRSQIVGLPVCILTLFTS